MSDIATKLSNSGQLLVRSGIEIDRILSAMVEDHTTVTASLPSQMFLSRLLHVDPVKQRLVLAYSDYKNANGAVLAASLVTFKCNHRTAQLAFASARPRAASYRSQPAIEMQMPDIMVALQYGRRLVRHPIPKEPPDLRCELRMNVISFESRLVDMSLDGRAFLLADRAIPVCAGTRLQGARIIPRGAEPVEVDIEVNHLIPTILPDGERATRIACRIVASQAAMDLLVGSFIIEFQ